MRVCVCVVYNEFLFRFQRVRVCLVWDGMVCEILDGCFVANGRVVLIGAIIQSSSIRNRNDLA